MKCRKAVTAKKVVANRRNAERSAGPRTDRGKVAARFNAVTLGLFAKHVVIPICDGYGSDREFRRLLDDLQQEFQPEGTFEEWLVVKIAESMWRLRRATRSEKGCVRTMAIWNDGPPENDPINDIFAKEVCLLTEAEEQIRTTGLEPHRLGATSHCDSTETESCCRWTSIAPWMGYRAPPRQSKRRCTLTRRPPAPRRSKAESR